MAAIADSAPKSKNSIQFFLRVKWHDGFLPLTILPISELFENSAPEIFQKWDLTEKRFYDLGGDTFTGMVKVGNYGSRSDSL